MTSSTSLVSLRNSRQAFSVLRNNKSQIQCVLPQKSPSDNSSRKGGLFRRSSSFAAQRSSDSNNATNTDGKPTPVRSVPFRSRSGGAAALMQRQYHLRQHYYSTSIHKTSDEELCPDDEDPEQILQQHKKYSSRSLSSSPIQKNKSPCTELPLLHSSLPFTNNNNTNSNNNNPRNNQRLHRLLCLCIAMGFTGLWMSMKLVAVRGEPQQQQPIHHANSNHPDNNNNNNLSDHELHTKYWQLLLLHHATTPDRLDDPWSPAHEALNWLVTNTLMDAEPSEDSIILPKFALATLYFATHTAGSLWERGEAQWAHTNNHYCDWYGITCHPEGTAVQKIELGGNALLGTIPRELFAGLKQLEVLDLSHNSLWGSLPDNWNAIPSLETLYLQNNALTGTIPAELSLAIPVVDLSYNEFQGTTKVPVDGS